MKRIVTMLGTGAVVFLVGCSAVRPPYTLSVGKLGVESQGLPATITIGSPQLYARESLINDRIGEVRLLQSLLKETEKDTFRDRFGSQIDRELSHSAALVASLSAAIDPRGRAGERRGEDAAARRAEIEGLQHAIEKEKLQQQLATLQSGTPAPAPETTPQESEASSDSTTPASSAGATTVTPSTTFGALDEAKKRHDALLAQPLTPVSAAAVSIDPQDQFRDVQAYRSVLRQALSAASLDDIHDHDGHALYRLQFQVTVFPGERNDLLGVVELEAMAPSDEAKDGDIERLYRRWLRHVASRLNQVLPKNRGLYTDPAYLRLGSAGLYSLVNVVLQDPIDKSVRRFRLPIPARDDKVSDVHLVLKRDCTTRAAVITPLFASPTRDCVENVRPVEIKDLSKYPKGLLANQLAAGLLAIDTARAERTLREPVELMIGALRTNDQIVSVTVPSNFTVALATAGSETNTKTKTESETQTKPEEPVAHEPATEAARVTSASTTDAAKTKAPKHWIGQPRAYAVSPPEHVQRISTNAQSATSVEAALAIATASLGDIAGLNASIGYLRSATGRIEALERSPLVVAFAAGGADQPSTDHGGNTTFGWALGPELRIDPDGRNLVYRHRVRTHELLADLSAPSWWPTLRIKARTSWRTVWGSQHGAANAPRTRCLASATCSDIERIYEIPLPANTASMEALTNVLSSATIGHIVSPTKINHIEPYYISACAERVRIQINGANIWRSTRVTLAGVESDKVEVLPDMEGISAEFELDDLFSTPNAPMDRATLEQGLTLTVWTRNGADSEILRLLGSRRPATSDTPATCSSRAAVAPSADENNGEIVSVSPTTIDQCAKQVDLIVKLSHPRSGDARTETATSSPQALAKRDPTLQFLLGTHAGQVLGRQPSRRHTSSSVHLRFTNGPFVAAPATGSVALSALIDDDISSMPLRVVACKAADGAPASAATTKSDARP